MGLFKKEPPLEEYERFSARRQLMEDLALTKNALDTAYANFESVVDPDLIDCYIYEVNSVLKRYKFLMEQAARLAPLPEEIPQKNTLNTETPVTSLIV